jgi:flagellar hook-basal body complex protein FliE
MAAISGLGSSVPLAAPRPPAPPVVAQPQQGFKDFMLQSLEQVNGMQMEANEAVQNLMTGGDVNPAEVLTTVQKADLAFRLMLQIRNKLVQAYQEIKDVRV